MYKYFICHTYTLTHTPAHTHTQVPKHPQLDLNCKRTWLHGWGVDGLTHHIHKWSPSGEGCYAPAPTCIS